MHRPLRNLPLVLSFTFALAWIPQNLMPVSSAQSLRENHLCKSLHECAEVGDTKTLNELLSQTTQIDVRNEFQETPLFTAVRYENKDATTLLISRGANVNAPDHDGSTPLMMAVLSQDLPLVSALISAGADVNASDHDGNAVLMHGAVFVLPQTGPILRLLVSRGANVNAAAKDGWTAFIFSIHGGAVEAVKTLVSLGCNVNAQDTTGLSALDHVEDISEASPNNAARSLQQHLRKVLIAAGATH